jgi:NAD(P)-dependent dehydrogenase (short-subunit alcohol dehydrogenase family)
MVRALAAFNPALIAFTGRHQARADDILKTLGEEHPGVRVKFVHMDVASLDAIQHAVASLLPQLDGRLDLLVCNAGIMATPAGLSVDGYEIQWATNYLGHALLVKLLLPCLLSTQARFEEARIVTLTSEGMMLAPRDGIMFNDLKTKQDFVFGGRWKRYAQSKLANVLYASQLAKQYPNLTSIAIHPGVVGTDLVSNLGLADRLLVYTTSRIVKPEDGCKNSLWAATVARRSLENGAYYSPIAEPGKRTKFSHDEKLAEKLWEWTGKTLQPYTVDN